MPNSSMHQVGGGTFKILNSKDETLKATNQRKLDDLISAIDTLKTKVTSLQTDRTEASVIALIANKRNFDSAYNSVVAKTWFGGKKTKSTRSSKSKTVKRR